MDGGPCHHGTKASQTQQLEGNTNRLLLRPMAFVEASEKHCTDLFQDLLLLATKYRDMSPIRREATQ